MRGTNAYFIRTLFMTFCFCSLAVSSFSQDLLERTKNKETISYTTLEGNRLYDLVEQQKKSTQSRSQSIELFTLSPSIPIEQSDSPELDIEKAVFLDLNLDNLRALRTARTNFITLSIPVNKNSAFTLELVAVDIHAPNFQTVTSSGHTIPSDGIYYRGVIKDIPNSIVALSLFNGEVSGLMSDDFGNYNLGKLKANDEYALYNDVDLKTKLSEYCGVVYDGNTNEEIIESSKNSNSTSRSADIVNVHLECDFAMYGNFSNDKNAVDQFARNVFNQMSTIYYNEGITTNLQYLKVWDTADPYTGTARDKVLNSFKSMLPSNSVQGDMAHVFSGKAQAGGFADTPSSSLCSLTPYAVTMLTETTYNPFPTYSNWVNIATHEMGHNLGSPHTHDCAWGSNNNLAIDNCEDLEGGCSSLVTNPTPDKELATIMSYCHTGYVGTVFLNRGFGTEPGDLIRAKVTASADCLNNCTVAPVADFINPQVICIGETVTFNSLTSCADDQSWAFTGGTPNSSTAIKPEITYNTAGTYIATATATNSIGTDNESKYVYVQNAPSGASSITGTNSGGGGILSFSLSNVNNSSNGASSAKYEDFSCSHIALLNTNTMYNFSLTFGTCGGGYFESYGMYIDYNGDGDFTDADEEVSSTGTGLSRCGPFGSNFTTIANPTLNQLLRLRIIVETYTTSITGPTYIPTTGQVEDYSVFFHDGSTPPPVGGEDLGDGACRSSMIITNDDVPGSTGTFRAATTIQTDGNSNNVVEVDANETVSFLAGTSVTLLPGFHAKSGSSFTAAIESCTAVREEENPIYYSTTSETEISDNDSPSINNFSNQNLTEVSLSVQPNPFDHQTTLRFNLPEKSNISLSIFNTNGQLISKILQKQATPKGVHTLNYDASDLQKGMYHILLQTDKTIQTEKIVVIK